jgi:hypothetical protein
MNEFELEIFEQTSDYAEVRLRGGVGVKTWGLDRAAIEEGTDSETGEPRYFVSNVLRPLIRPLISDEEYRQACAAAARSLFGLWLGPAPAAAGDAPR